MSKKRRFIRIYSPVRFYIFLTVLSLFCVMALSLLGQRGSATDQISYITVLVKEGDNLWNIAKETVPNNKDIRDYIQEIRKINKLDDANIKVGQLIQVPIY